MTEMTTATEKHVVELSESALFSQRMENWTHNRDVVLDKAAAVVAVTDNESFDMVANVRKLIATLIAEISTTRKDLTRELDNAKKNIMAQEKALTQNLEAENARLARLLNQYATIQAEKARQAEKVRQEAEAEREMQKEAAEEMGISAVFAPIIKQEVETPKSVNAKQVKVAKFEITDATLVPREFCNPDEKLIKAWMQYQKGLGKDVDSLKVPGIRFWNEIRVDNK